MSIKTVIFDLGRVLVGVEATGEKFGKIMRSMGIDPNQAFSRYWNASEVLEHMTGKIDSREFYRLAGERFGLTCSFEEFAESWCDLFHPVPWMREIFLAVAERRGVGLLSDTDPLHWNRILADYEWLEAIPRPTLSHETGFLKPRPEAYAAAVRNCGSLAEECLFIDDVQANVDGALAAGMVAIRFTGPENLLKDLKSMRIL